MKNISISDEKEKNEFLINYDFDRPEALDWVLYEKCIKMLKKRKFFDSPIYDVSANKRIAMTQRIDPSDLIIIEGRIYWNNEFLRENCDIKLFLDTDQDLMLSRRVFKGLARNRDLTRIINRYINFVKPAYTKYIEPTKVYADLVAPNFGGEEFDLSAFDGNYEILSIV